MNIREIGSVSHLDEFGSQMFASQYVNCFEIQLDAHSSRQQQDDAT
jgi:hypothetical protein